MSQNHWSIRPSTPSVDFEKTAIVKSSDGTISSPARSALEDDEYHEFQKNEGYDLDMFEPVTRTAVSRIYLPKLKVSVPQEGIGLWHSEVHMKKSK
jgi:hypothetical protein